MRAIFKYPLANVVTQTISLPLNAHALSVQTQFGELVLYALVNPDEKTKEYVDVSLQDSGFTISKNENDPSVLNISNNLDDEYVESKTFVLPMGNAMLVVRSQKDSFELISITDAHNDETKPLDDETDGTFIKYKLEAVEKQTIALPLNSKIMSARSEGNDVFLEVSVDPNQKSEENEYVDLCVYGTGHAAPDSIEEYTFLDTIEMYGGGMMFHAFYKKHQ